MTALSRHEYSARVLDPAGDIPVSLAEDAGGTITLDADAIPHVSGTVTLAVEDAMLLEQLDPRDSRRLVIDVNATFLSQQGLTRQRSFDLGIRSAVPDRAGGTVTLSLASDEALLRDYAQLVDDHSPRAHETSLRAVCNYVLGKIGAALEPGGPDADVTAYWSVSSLVSNPSFEVDTAGWSAGTNATAPVRFSDTAQGEVSGAWVARWASTAAGISYLDYQDISIKPGSSYVLSAYMYSEGASRRGRVMLRFKGGNGATLHEAFSAPVALQPDAWSRVSVIATAPAGAEKATLHLEHQTSAAGQAARADGVMFHEGKELVTYHDGSTPDTATYDYSWSGVAHASNSTRTPSVERPPEALIWRAGVSGMDFLEPLLKASGLRLVCDEQRRWTLRDIEYRAAGAQTFRYGVNIETADESLSREANEWFDGAVYEYIWTDADGIEQRRVDAFALAPSPTKILRVEVRDTPYPGPGRAEHIVRRAQSRGRTVTVSAIPTWLEQTDRPLSVLLEGTPIQTGIAGAVQFDLSTDTVTVTSRTTDTPAGAIDLLPGTINALPGTINAL